MFLFLLDLFLIIFKYVCVCYACVRERIRVCVFMWMCAGTLRGLVPLWSWSNRLSWISLTWVLRKELRLSIRRVWTPNLLAISSGWALPFHLFGNSRFDEQLLAMQNSTAEMIWCKANIWGAWHVYSGDRSTLRGKEEVP